MLYYYDLKQKHAYYIIYYERILYEILQYTTFTLRK